MTADEIVDYDSCIGCGQAVVTRTVWSGEPRMTHHVEPLEDAAQRCDYDFGPFLGGKRRKQYPGDTYP